jgi:flagellar biosynthesis/type III secretory pathway protein FliH
VTHHAAWACQLPDILYAEDFDEPPRVAPPPEPMAVAIPDPTALDAAWQEGFAAGQHEASVSIAASQAAETVRMVAMLRQAIDSADTALAASLSAAASEVVGLVGEALRAILPSLLREHGHLDVQAALTALRAGIDPACRLVIETSAETHRRLAGLLADLPPNTEWSCSDTLGPGDVRVHWRHGHFTRSGQTILQTLMACLADLSTTTTIRGHQA